MSNRTANMAHYRARNTGNAEPTATGPPVTTALSEAGTGDGESQAGRPINEAQHARQGQRWVILVLALTTIGSSLNALYCQHLFRTGLDKSNVAVALGDHGGQGSTLVEKREGSPTSLMEGEKTTNEETISSSTTTNEETISSTASSQARTTSIYVELKSCTKIPTPSPASRTFNRNIVPDTWDLSNLPNATDFTYTQLEEVAVPSGAYRKAGLFPHDNDRTHADANTGSHYSHIDECCQTTLAMVMPKDTGGMHFFSYGLIRQVFTIATCKTVSGDKEGTRTCSAGSMLMSGLFETAPETKKGQLELCYFNLPGYCVCS